MNDIYKGHSEEWHSKKGILQNDTQQRSLSRIEISLFEFYVLVIIILIYSLQTVLKSAIVLNVVAPFWNAVQIGVVAEEKNTHGKRAGAPKELST